MAKVFLPNSISEESSPRKITFEEFLAWDGDNQDVESVRGRVIQLSPVSDRHPDTVGFLASLLRVLAEEASLGVVRTEPAMLRLNTEETARSPDIVFLRNERLAQIQKMFIEAPVDLVIEVVSPSSIRVDKIEKRAEYELSGIREYWIIDPITNTTVFLVVNADGRYEEANLDERGCYLSRALGNLPIDPRWFKQVTLPRVMPILKEWGLP